MNESAKVLMNERVNERLGIACSLKQLDKRLRVILKNSKPNQKLLDPLTFSPL